VKSVENYDSANRVAEFNLNRVAVARGGEHNQARYDEGTWDSYFQAPDFDWNIIKQTERQYMLVFCDLILYRLCPFCSLAVFYLFGGLRRDNVSALKAPYIFPHLRNMKNESVATRMTKTLRNNNEHEHRRAAFTSRSMRKGSMTELRLHRDLSYEEELARSGHTILPANTLEDSASIMAMTIESNDAAEERPTKKQKATASTPPESATANAGNNQPTIPLWLMSSNLQGAIRLVVLLS